MIDVKYFSGLYPQLPAEFLLQLDDNLRRLARQNAVHIALIDTTAGSENYQLPDGKAYALDHHVVKIDASVNTITVLPFTGQTVTGGANYSLGAQYASVRFTFARETDDWVLL